MEKQGDSRSLGELFADLSRETSTLIRHEMELAKAEMSQKAGSVGKDIGFLVVGGAVLYAGFLVLLAAVALLLALVLPHWAAALLVALVVLAAGGLLVKRGLDNLKKQSLAPQQTIETLKEDAQWATKQVTH